MGLDLKGGIEVLLKADPEPKSAGSGGLGDDAGSPGEVTPEQMKGAIEVVRNRVDPQGTKEMFISTVGTDRILLQVPGEKNPENVRKTIGKTALLEFLDTGDESFPEDTDFNVEGTTRRKDEYSKYETILTGKDLSRADAQFDNGRPVIGFEFKPDAGQIFGEFTNNHVGKTLTVLLDGVVLTSPNIEEPIWGGSGIIRGSMTAEDVDRVVRQLNAGALPVPLTILSASVVGPTLGQESIDRSVMAGYVGFAIVLLFMLLIYRLPGLISNFALALYVVVVLGTLSLAGAALTLPGIAGFLLSVGMAIDANIIVYERLKEELRWGKTLHAALDASFARGWGAIIDGQVATLIGAAVLYFFGTGPIKGFAVTLFIGNILALFTGVFVTRVLLQTFSQFAKSPTLYAPPVTNTETPREQLQRGHFIRFIERSGLWFGISAFVILGGLGMMALGASQTGKALNLGIDYTGGEKIILEMKQAMPIDGQPVAVIVKKFAEGEATVQVDASNPKVVSIRMRPKAEGANEQELAINQTNAVSELKTELGNAYGGFVEEGISQNPVVREQSYVGPTVGAELIQNALWSLLVGSILIMFYIFWRFGQWPYSISAVLAILHNVLVTIAVTAALKLEINASFIAVVLTIVGYSINDTIIIFDRVRENVRAFGKQFPLGQLANLSLTQTLTRSFNTVLMVMIMTGTLMIFGGENLRDFMIAMLAGLLATAYSSICIATPIMRWLARRAEAGRGAATAGSLSTGAGGAAALSLGESSTEVTSVAAQVEAARERRERKGDAPKQRRR
ncbi:MAG: protein translocase subunit SecD [bacterium]|nr:protein translocase subunit SecD [bacterium]